MVPIQDVIARLKEGYGPMLLKAELTPKGHFLKVEVSYPDDRFFGSLAIRCSDFRSEENVDNVIRCHRRQMYCSGIALDAWYDSAEQKHTYGAC
jgi:hypothetical protein